MEQDNKSLSTLGQLMPFEASLFCGGLVLIFGLALAANLLLIFSIIMRQELRQSPAFNLILSQACSELILVMAAIPLMIQSALFGPWTVHSLWCDASASLIIISGVTSLSTFALIGVNRFLLVFYPVLYKRLFTLSSTRKMCASVWLLGVVCDVPNYTGLTRHAYDARLFICLIETSNHLYINFLMMSFAVVPLVLLTVLYSLIMRRVFENEAKLSRWLIIRGPRADSNRLLKTLCVSFLFYLVCWIPMTVCVLTQIEEPKRVLMFLPLLAYSHTVVNPVFTTLYNTRLRRSVFNRFHLTNEPN
nr:G protein-coupled receptor [Proales similis]